MTSKYSPEDRLRAATAMVMTGNSLAASKETGIPGSTLRHWHRHDQQFQGMMAEVWLEHGERIRSQLAEIIEVAHEQTLERLELGDEVILAPESGLEEGARVSGS